MSTSAGASEPGNGVPPSGEGGRSRDLRDRPFGRILLLVVVLLVAAFAARTCASSDKEVSQDEAVAIAVEAVGFEPCDETKWAKCVQIRYLQRGFPVRGYWLVGLAPRVDATGEPVGAKSVLVDVETGLVTPA